MYAVVGWPGEKYPTFEGGAESVYTFHQPRMSVPVASFLLQHLVFSHVKFLHQTLEGNKVLEVSTCWLLLLHLSALSVALRL